MHGRRSVKVIFDTNIWISFLIGKRLHFLSDIIAEKKVKIIVSPRLMVELKNVTARPKLSRYFKKDKVNELIQFIEFIGLMSQLSGSLNLKKSAQRQPHDTFGQAKNSPWGYSNVQKISTSR